MRPVGQPDVVLKQWLIDEMENLDRQKRDIRQQIRDRSVDDKHKDRAYFSWLRKAKAKISFLVEEREAIRQELGALNQRIKSENLKRHRLHQTPLTLAQAFMMIAEAEMNPDEYDALVNVARTEIDNSGT